MLRRFALVLMLLMTWPAQAAQLDRAFHACTGVQNPVDFFGQAQNVIPILPPVLEPLRYRWDGQKYVAPKGKNTPIRSRIMHQPMHGQLTLYDAENHLYWYEPSPEYRGGDRALFEIHIGSSIYKLDLRIDVVGNIDFDDYCRRPQRRSR